MILKGYNLGGCIVIAEDKEEAVKMYVNETGCLPYNEPIEQDLDEHFYYFNIEDIDPEDYVNIYDRKYPLDGKKLISLKRPFARKYRNVTGDKKEVLYLYY